VQDLAQHQVPVLGFELAKGLELDGVVVCGPEHAHDGSATGARLFYIAVTRAVQSLAVVTTRLDVLQVLGVERMDVS
jgi:DNA helicase IV